jgi:prevent-host-death family protein
MIQMNIHQAKTHFSKLINRVLDGEEVIIARDSKPVAKLIPVSNIKSKRRLGSAKGQIIISRDFDEIPKEFQEYLS